MTLIRIQVDNEALRAVQRVPGALRAAIDSWTGRGSVLVRGEMVRQIRSRQKTVGRTGRLSNSVASFRVAGGFAVGPTVNYAPFVDQPTRPHIIEPRRAKALIIPGAGGRIGFTRAGRAFTATRVGGRTVRSGVGFARRVRHPGTRGMFFVRHTAQAVGAPLGALLNRELQTQLKRVGA